VPVPVPCPSLNCDLLPIAHISLHSTLQPTQSHRLYQFPRTQSIPRQKRKPSGLRPSHSPPTHERTEALHQQRQRRIAATGILTTAGEVALVSPCDICTATVADKSISDTPETGSCLIPLYLDANARGFYSLRHCSIIQSFPVLLKRNLTRRASEDQSAHWIRASFWKGNNLMPVTWQRILAPRN